MGGLFLRKEDNKLNIYFVFWGPSGAGKTTSLEYLYKNVPFSKKGELLKIEDANGSTMMFDFIPFVVLPEEEGNINVLFHCYTVPGQDVYEDRRDLLLNELNDVDGIIFVVDSQKKYLSDNIRSFKELKEKLAKYLNKTLGKDVPFIVFLNKRDLPNVLPKDVLAKNFNDAVDYVETVAIRGDGILEGFKKISEFVLKKLLSELE